MDASELRAKAENVLNNGTVEWEADKMVNILISDCLERAENGYYKFEWDYRAGYNSINVPKRPNENNTGPFLFAVFTSVKSKLISKGYVADITADSSRQIYHIKITW